MRKTLLTLALAIGAFSTALNAVVLGPTLKDISTYFNVSDARAGQLGTIHSVIAAMVGILAAPLLDRYGPKRVLRFECVMLLAGTAISALAPSFALLFVGRAVAGIGGAIIAATCFVCVSQIFTDPVERNRKVGVVTSASSVAGVIGVPLLVIIGQHASWRWSIGSLAIPLLVVVIATWSLPSAENDGPRQSLRDEYVDRFRTVGQSRATVLLAWQLRRRVRGLGWRPDLHWRLFRDRVRRKPRLSQPDVLRDWRRLYSRKQRRSQGARTISDANLLFGICPIHFC